MQMDLRYVVGVIRISRVVSRIPQSVHAYEELGLELIE